METAGIDCILVGDSLGNVIQGHATTLPVTEEDILYHCKAVSRSLNSILLIADMPFHSSALTVEHAVRVATRFMSEGKASMVKIEGASPLTLQIIRALTERNIPVFAHLGLTPQSIHTLGSYKVQGKKNGDAERIERDAAAVEEAGASLLLLECVPTSLAEKITSQLRIPVIGLGAGVKCDGQLLIVYDILTITPGKHPKFVKNFLEGRSTIGEALKAYVTDVRSGEFPTREQTYH